VKNDFIVFSFSTDITSLHSWMVSISLKSLMMYPNTYASGIATLSRDILNVLECLKLQYEIQMGNLQFAGNFDIHLTLDSIRLVSIPGLAAVLDQLVDVLFFLYPCHVFFQMVMAGMLLLIAYMLEWAFFRLFLLGFIMMVMVVLLFFFLLFSRSRKGLEHLQVLMEGFQRLQDIEITVSGL
jgi:hypothetical protein